MRCHKAERWLLRDLDGRLSLQAKGKLASHLQGCPNCVRKRRDYALILGALRTEPASPSADFLERLRMKLGREEKPTSWAWMGEWSLRAVPLSLILILALLVAMLFFLPSGSGDLGQAEALLLRNENPYLETKALLEETRLEKKNLMLIFTAEEKSPARSYIP